MIFSRTHEVVAAQGDLKSWFGLEEVECIGKTRSEIEKIQGTFLGTGRVTRWVNRVDLLDAITDFESPSGYHILRSIELAKFNAHGHYVGVIKLAAGQHVNHDASLKLRDRAIEVLHEMERI